MNIHLSFDLDIVVLSDVNLLVVGLGVLLPLDDDEGVPDVGVGQSQGGPHTLGLVELKVSRAPAEASHLVPQHRHLGDVSHGTKVSGKMTLSDVPFEISDENALRIISVRHLSLLLLDKVWILNFLLGLSLSGGCLQFPLQEEFSKCEFYRFYKIKCQRKYKTIKFLVLKTLPSH